MRVCILINRRRPLGWQKNLADHLSEAGHDVCFGRVDDGSSDWHASAWLLIELEALIYPKIGAELLRPVPVPECQQATELANAGPFDLVIQCARCGVAEMTASRTLIPKFDGCPDESGALLALLEHQEFSIGIKEQIGEHSLESSYVPALDGSLSIVKSLGAVCSRVGELLAECVGGSRPLGALEACSRAGISTPHVGPTVLSRYAASVLKTKITRHINEVARKGSGWAVAWRAIDKEGPFATSSAAEATYNVVANDARGYLADPFPFVHDSKTYLFVEDFDYASGKGAICVLSRGEDGTFGKKSIVLEQPYHLSYPMIFTHGGDIWMIPESGATGRVELYRAEAFPSKWVREAVLIEGIRAFDATLHIDRGGYWLFCSTSYWGASTCDQLQLFHASHLLGPWTACSREARIFDARVARPGGMLFWEKSNLMRPAQDCSRMYGGAIQLCKIDELSTTGFAQTLISRLEPVDRSLFWGAHTYNARDGIEAIDVFGYPHAQRHVTLRRRSAIENDQADRPRFAGASA